MTAVCYTQKQQEANDRILQRLTKKKARKKSIFDKLVISKKRNSKGQFMKEPVKTYAQLKQEVFDELMRDQDNGIYNSYIRACYREVEGNE